MAVFQLPIAGNLVTSSARNDLAEFATQSCDFVAIRLSRDRRAYEVFANLGVDPDIVIHQDLIWHDSEARHVRTHWDARPVHRVTRVEPSRWTAKSRVPYQRVHPGREHEYERNEKADTSLHRDLRCGADVRDCQCEGGERWQHVVDVHHAVGRDRERAQQAVVGHEPDDRPVCDAISTMRADDRSGERDWRRQSGERVQRPCSTMSGPEK